MNIILLISYDIKAFNTYTSPSFDTHKLNSCGKLLRSFVLSFIVYLLHLEACICLSNKSVLQQHTIWSYALGTSFAISHL